METTSQTSKVTVEYHDPAGVFSLVSRDIASRLPLRNLNWQSPPRPLRQIKSLHVEFVPDKDTQSSLRPTVSHTDSDGPTTSFDIVRGGGGDPRRNAVKERRHQIPGFRTSPYLKIYVLRCDDKDTYKTTSRRKIREWIRDNAQPDGKREDHDAFEWMILHVVIPDTIAASEPRWRESVKDPEELKERKGGSKLIGKSTRTVFDRLRADFNESGKSGQDRVAQIRLTKDRVPADLLPTPAVAQTLEESPQERENAWSHLISKFKTQILGPFDRRVRQYEADIAEQEARRSFPGWNFCTFFIHKEGLAKALESIGLVEDAVAIYDELSLDLESVLREIAAGEAQGTATSFAGYTDDIKQRILNLAEKHTNGISDHGTDPEATRDAAALFSKDYRERIVRSDISVFDFFCYIYSRQKALILRLANAKAIRVQLGANADREGGEDLVLTSEACWRASNFIHNAARCLRQDLANAATSGCSDVHALEVDGLVCSWTWAIAGQVLEDTAVPALLEITKHGAQEPPQVPNGKPRRPHTSTVLGANIHPQRTTSLPVNKAKQPELSRPQSEHRAHDDAMIRPSSSAGPDAAPPVGIPGQAELATYRAELVLLRRKMLEQLARQRGWYTGWSHVSHSKQMSMQNVSLEDATKDSVLAEGDQPSKELHTLGPTLRRSLETEQSFRLTYEQITDIAIRHYFAATQSKSTHALLGDLAVLKCQQGEYDSAASYFQHTLPLLATDSWNLMEFQTLRAYLDCLKHLGRHEDYAQNGLTLLMKSFAKKTDIKVPHTRFFPQVQDDALDISGLFADVLASSASLQKELIRPVKSFFEEITLDPEVRHQTDTDSFTLSLQLRHVLGDAVTLDQVRARLVSHEDPTQEIWLACDGNVTLLPSLNKIELVGTTVAYGAFLIDKIVLGAGKIHFVEELRPPPKPTPLGFTEFEPPTVTIVEPEKPPAFVYLYPAERAFGAEIRRSTSIHIDRPRHLDILLDAGRNEIEAIEIKLKPTSAGLRLHLADTIPNGIDLNKEEASKPGQILLRNLKSGGNASVTVPYTVEQSSKEIRVRVEIRYTTTQGIFTLLSLAKVFHELPLDVDVNDSFQLDALYSTFMVRTTNRVPFSILGAQLKDSPVYAIEAPPVLPLPLNIFESQPMNLVYKITRKTATSKTTMKKDAALALHVSYQPMDEILLQNLCEAFVEDLGRSDFGDLCRLLTPMLLERSRKFIRGADLEMAALLGEARIPDFDTVGWQELVATLRSDRRSRLEAWLRRWHADHVAVPVLCDEGRDTATHEIIISVDVPNVDMVFSASLHLQQLLVPAASGRQSLVLGEPVQATVQIKSTAQWSAKSIFPNVPTFKIQGDNERPTSFVCDVSTDNDTWIVGGQRRCHFVPQNDKEHSVHVILIPLKLGTHPLPFVEVQQESSDPESNDRELDDGHVSCHTHYENAGKLVQVIRNVRTSRIDIPEALAAVALPPSRPGTASTKEAG
ncbi:Hypothetical predicted protein [Lecanosticta acicola]|uniref:Trafficking protein particle complex subunit 10 n=1 Tax=Lecanosticta acicola TaxID=111012 RepID=A0AAI8Z267_9PEZI|nr:Hypothetical predicted protein [Lecanosticta acicola]